MTPSNVEQIERQIDRLTTAEREQVLHYLLQAPSTTVTNINELRGTIKLTIDPLEYQRDARDGR
ncbi:MAG TPA: hypothetical protein VK934_08200 [Fimbriimonas sp.]|nr:hypothetical protein [Fimbriimonas sp.]